MLMLIKRELAKRENCSDGWMDGGKRVRCLFRVIDFASKDDMKRALRKLDNSELNGKHIHLRSEVSTSLLRPNNYPNLVCMEGLPGPCFFPLRQSCRIICFLGNVTDNKTFCTGCIFKDKHTELHSLAGQALSKRVWPARLTVSPPLCSVHVCNK